MLRSINNLHWHGADEAPREGSERVRGARGMHTGLLSEKYIGMVLWSNEEKYIRCEVNRCN